MIAPDYTIEAAKTFVAEGKVILALVAMKLSIREMVRIAANRIV